MQSEEQNLKNMELRSKAFQQLYPLSANLVNYTGTLRAAKYKTKRIKN